jgi:hypothetical protein
LNPHDYAEKLPKKFKKLVESGILSVKHIHEMIDENTGNLRPEIKANEVRWPLDDIGYFKGKDFEKEVQLMKDWIKERLPRIEKYLEELQPISKGEYSFGSVIRPLAYDPPMVFDKPVGSAIQAPDY